MLQVNPNPYIGVRAVGYSPNIEIFKQAILSLCEVAYSLLNLCKTKETLSYPWKFHEIWPNSQMFKYYINFLVDILTGWTGPLSLSVFVPDIELAIAKRYIAFLSKCFPNIDKQVNQQFSQNPKFWGSSYFTVAFSNLAGHFF